MDRIPKDLYKRLLQNSLASAYYGVDLYHQTVMRFPPNTWKLQISALLVFHAIEQALKARLAKDDPLFIFKKRDYRKKTLGFDKLLSELGKLPVVGDHSAELAIIKKCRNEIHHCVLEASYVDLDQALAIGLAFLKFFLMQELEIYLEEITGEDPFFNDFSRRISEILQTAAKQVEFALKQVKRYERKKGIAILKCKECGNEAVVVPDPRTKDNRAYCFVCSARHDSSVCPRCSKYHIARFSFRDLSIDCPECAGNIPTVGA